MLTDELPPPFTPIPISSSDTAEADVRAVPGEASSSGLPQADQVKAFEENLSAFTGSRYAIAVSSGKLTLDLCLPVLGIGAGDLVITTPFAPFAATGALLSVGAVPVFVDVEPRTGSIDPHLVFAATQDIMQGGKNTQAWLPPSGASADGKLKAILPVDISGQTTDLELILNTAWKYKLKVIEESSEALGASYQGHPAGTLGDCGTYSINFSYQGSTYEAGAVITDDPGIASEMFSLRDQSLDHGKDFATKSPSAIDYRPVWLGAVLGVAYLRRLEKQLARRSQVAEWYRQRLVEINGIDVPAIARHANRVSWPVYVVRLAPGLDRQVIIGKLNALGIPSRPYFNPLHLRPDIMEQYGFREGTFPVAEDLGRRCLALPFSADMEQHQVETVCQALRQVVSN